MVNKPLLKCTRTFKNGKKPLFKERSYQPAQYRSKKGYLPVPTNQHAIPKVRIWAIFGSAPLVLCNKHKFVYPKVKTTGK